MASTSSPTRRSTSARVRTVVVLPVPPLSDRTAIVSAMERGRLPKRALGGAVGLAGHGARVDDGRVEEPQRVAAHGDPVAVAQRAPLHPLAVDVDAVERAVDEHTPPGRLT